MSIYDEAAAKLRLAEGYQQQSTRADALAIDLAQAQARIRELEGELGVAKEDTSVARQSLYEVTGQRNTSLAYAAELERELETTKAERNSWRRVLERETAEKASACTPEERAVLDACGKFSAKQLEHTVYVLDSPAQRLDDEIGLSIDFCKAELARRAAGKGE